MKEKKMNKQEMIDNGSYNKPGKHFKFPRSVRAFLSSISNKAERDQFRFSLIQATLHGNKLPEKKVKNKNGVPELAV
jgi:hypothetical protein